MPHHVRCGSSCSALAGPATWPVHGGTARTRALRRSGASCRWRARTRAGRCLTARTPSCPGRAACAPATCRQQRCVRPQTCRWHTLTQGQVRCSMCPAWRPCQPALALPSAGICALAWSGCLALACQRLGSRPKSLMCPAVLAGAQRWNLNYVPASDAEYLVQVPFVPLCVQLQPCFGYWLPRQVLAAHRPPGLLHARLRQARSAGCSSVPWPCILALAWGVLKHSSAVQLACTHEDCRSLLSVGPFCNGSDVILAQNDTLSGAQRWRCAPCAQLQPGAGKAVSHTCQPAALWIWARSLPALPWLSVLSTCRPRLLAPSSQGRRVHSQAWGTPSTGCCGHSHGQRRLRGVRPSALCARRLQAVARGASAAYNLVAQGPAGCTLTYLSAPPCLGGDNLQAAPSDDGTGGQQFLLQPVAPGCPP